MAHASRLKVYRTAMGFFDAVVAAPSQAAALKAWGLTSNLFAEGLAEEVKGDPGLLAEASANPGEIVRKPRGDPAAVLAQPAPTRSSKPTQSKKGDPPPPVVPMRRQAPPDRTKLDEAERALAQAEGDLAAHLKAIAEERAELEAQERRTRRDGNRLIAACQKVVDAERDTFEISS